MKNSSHNYFRLQYVSVQTVMATILFMLLLFFFGKLRGQLAPEPPEGYLAGQAENPSKSPEPGLLFYLSGDQKFVADFAAGGQDKPNFLSGLKIIPDGAIGSAFEAEDSQLMSYWAPGNIYSQRGTLSFFWRSRYPVGPTPFPVFRVAFADHTSWDMAWLRIDYNGSGFDAFVTDVGLTQTRVSHYMEQFPGPGEWTHITFTWDETEGVRLYINGVLAEEKTIMGKVYDTGLDQFGPHSRIISPYQVQSMYSFRRGGDLDELRIYDRMLSDSNIERLSEGKIPEKVSPLHRDLHVRQWRDAWWDRHGWNLPNDPPPPLETKHVVVKKIGIHEAYDVKRWMWKANDGIRETTWPGVYNMSRLPGRYDYFIYPDWDCYSMSGQSIRFELPDEPWNHVEVWGKAWGQLSHEKEHVYDHTFGLRTKEQVKSYHHLETDARGGKIRFDNALIEEPIGELGVYYVHEGKAPEGSASESFSLIPLYGDLHNEALDKVSAFIHGRYPADERSRMIGIKQKENPVFCADESPQSPNPLPFIHLLIPFDNQPEHGLDGIELEIPALDVVPTHGDLYPMNIRVKDPLWPMRDLADFSFSVMPGTAHTLWIDTRDLVLPDGQSLYITLAGAGIGITTEALKGSRIRLVYKQIDQAKAEHELDRFTQIRDLYGFTVEERPSTSRLNLYNRFVADYTDLMKVNPDHWLGKSYNYARSRNVKDRPEFELPKCPEGVPQWAFLQVEYLRYLERLISYYIDDRQVANGEFGGGLSDDDDFSNLFVGAAFMGIHPEKIGHSLRLLLESYYDQDRDPYDAGLRQRSLPLFTNGLATITTDLLHAYEEGIEAVGQLMLLEYGNPLYFSRGMEIAKRVLEDITQIAPDGHRHFRSRLFGGTSVSTEDPWQWSGHYSLNMLHTPYLISLYNGHPALRQMIVEVADGLLAHRDEEGNFYTEIHFGRGEVQGRPGLSSAWQVFLAAYEITGDPRYFHPIEDLSSNTREFDPAALVSRYSENIRNMAVLEHSNTVGSIWIDRIFANTNDIQKDRLGGVALTRIGHIYPQHFVSWNIDKPADYQSLATFVQKADHSTIEVLAYNMEKEMIHSEMTLWGITPGTWQLVFEHDTDNNQKMDDELRSELVYLERGSKLNLSFAPKRNSYIHLKLIEPASTGYMERPDLALCSSGIRIEDNQVTVRVYSQGSVGTPASSIELRDAKGELVGSMPVPALEGPLDLVPKWVDIKLIVAPGTDLSSGSVQVDPLEKIDQITRINTRIAWD